MNYKELKQLLTHASVTFQDPISGKIIKFEKDWRREPPLTPKQQQVFNYLFFTCLLIVIVIFIGTRLYAPDDIGVNVYTDIVSIIVTVGILDWRNRRRDEQQLKAQLIREMSSTDNGIALRALKELTESGYVKDGSLGIESFMLANLKGALLQGAQLQAVDLTNSNLEEANMWGIDLSESVLLGANLKKAIMTGAHLNSVEATSSGFEYAQLNEGNLEYGSFDNADFQGANLKAANFKNADLSRANLCGAKLNEANLEGANLTDTKFDRETILPDGTKWDGEPNCMDRFINPKHSQFWRPSEPLPYWIEGGKRRNIATDVTITKGYRSRAKE